MSAPAVVRTGIDETVADIFAPISEAITSVVFYAVPIGGTELPLIVAWLILAACFFTVWLGFQNIRGFRHAIDLVRGKYSDPDDAGEVSHFQALATAVSGTVGLGNIAGVAVAISLGGPGATFWMIVAGFLGMSTKMAECTLGVKFRREHADGTVSGGPMYYLRDGVASVGKPGLGKVLARMLADAARAHGVTRIHATMLSNNPPALALMAVIAERLRDAGHVSGVHEVVAELGAAA